MNNKFNWFDRIGVLLVKICACCAVVLILASMNDENMNKLFNCLGI